jgi:hypothetical protein
VSFTTHQHEDGYQPSRDRTTSKWYVVGTEDDPLGARAALEGAMSYVLTNGHWLQDIEMGPLIGTEPGKFWWEAEVIWGVSSSPAAGSGELPVLRFSTKGGKQHITQSRGTTRFYRPSPYLPSADFSGAIGVTPNGVQGVDITVPAFSFSYSFRVAASAINDAYVSLLRVLTGSVNVSTFKGQPAGTVRFDGADGQRRGADLDIEFSFSGEASVDDATIGDIEGIDKDGFDYLWVLYEDVEDEASAMLAKRPVGVYVEQVYPRYDLNLLGI